ncbi:methyltransferase family protein [Desulfolutivibrio sulfoxidireducens]|uniref:methyltransferase family protein n=1 Tax=Desulfolutivibrio sulfoxidireducens TaxID=2773299 RepID=UPI00159E79E0|nr:isoprenylcysteine carboxylmethyltransferase family protein [Desulfolutivibrio sulfoxidireducens]QLA17912.1 isoprenylcysteine carboxylmethyltransferase family protein [Desulfolutivibrio sulfoxidireducens]QLA21492.1 isoprenylcysteine carboxylmethyltransferase family protein [Desulfolutivibrio sulfoxidireducens]
MNRWGAGTALYRASLCYTKLAFLYDELLFAAVARPYVKYLPVRPVGTALVLLGIAIYAAAIMRLYQSYDTSRLETGGIYAVLRHPMYAAWVVCIIPGVSLLAGGFLVLTAPLFTAFVYRLAIRHEEVWLESTFGETYRAYRARVGGVVPGLTG